MQPTPAGADTRADFGSITGVIEAADAYFQKLLHFRAVKRDLAQLRAEHDQLQRELFGEGAQ
jgi:hypothetical protein